MLSETAINYKKSNLYATGAKRQFYSLNEYITYRQEKDREFLRSLSSFLGNY